MTITEALLIFWIVCAVTIVVTTKVYKIIIFFGIFSLLSAVAYLLLGAPDVAMAEAAISAFATIFFIVCIEKYYSRDSSFEDEYIEQEVTPFYKRIARRVPPLILTVFIFVLFTNFIPDSNVSTYLRDQYLQLFAIDVGGENAVAAILLGYRVYDTLFEALLLVTAVVAVAHVSYYSRLEAISGQAEDPPSSGMAKLTMRIISPVIIVFGIYLIANGHISAGGGFQGGLAVASFFICRYFIHDIYDIPVKKVMKMEEIVFINITILPVIAIFMGAAYITEFFNHTLYMIAMNLMIGFKVACGFFILFYRYVAIERR